MNQVVIDGKTYFTPSDWNELTKKQVLFISRLFQGQLTMVDFKLRALFDFLSVRPKVTKRIHPEDAYFLCESLDFLFKEVSLTRNLIPVIRTCWRKFVGPSDAMMNCTFGESLDAAISLAYKAMPAADVAIFPSGGSIIPGTP